MELRYGTLSPYVRKVRVVAEELGIADRIKLVLTNTREKPEEIVPLNPLGKIPTLLTDDGMILFDSPVVCEYLDATFGSNRLLPASGPRRWEVMTSVALADGIIDSAIMSRQEKARPAPAAIRRVDRLAVAQDEKCSRSVRKHSGGARRASHGSHRARLRARLHRRFALATSRCSTDDRT